jgi:hypothetical protein
LKQKRQRESWRFHLHRWRAADDTHIGSLAAINTIREKSACKNA